MGKNRRLIDIPDFDKYLKTAYCTERKTMAQIASELGRTPSGVLYHLRRFGIETRSSNDYETTEKQREAWRKIGHAGKGKTITDEQKAAISKANKGRRKRTDYEFGGHEKKRDDGYVAVYCPDHPNANLSGYVMKHHLVMEHRIGCVIPAGCVVHHVNHIRDDNRIENLELMTIREHARLHMLERNERMEK